MLITEQSDQLQKLKQVVRGTEQVRSAEAQGKLLRLPTGDGGALVFRTSPEAPVLCALEISKALKSHPELRVRMGIHSGPVNEISDLNEQANIAGAGINIAQRVMDCGDAGHILLSQHVLFIDIVGYSKLLINEQSEQIQTLREIVRATEQFRLAEGQGKLMRLPTGDGGALVFRNSPEAPALCALEISKALRNHPELCVRMRKSATYSKRQSPSRPTTVTASPHSR